MNRVRSLNYPKTICEVVYQRKQFSWTNKRMKKHKINEDEWQKSINAATAAYNTVEPFEATHYHNLTVSPRWGLKKLIKIGNHIFYV